jgi:2-haloacid dehalogenase
MSIAVVLHLREDGLSRGEIIGEVEVVDSGESRRVRGTADLLAFLQRLAGPSGSVLSAGAHHQSRSRPGSPVTHITDFDALSFDCYGTLIDWEAGISAALAPWVERHGIALSADALLERYAAVEKEEERESPSSLYPEILAAALRNLGADVGAAVTDDDEERLSRSVPDWPAFPDSPAALARLATRYKLIILSNVDRESFAGSNARLQVRFDAIVTAQDVGSYKPDARNFEALLATAGRLGVEPGRLLHVAQSLFHDHVPAHSAGLQTVWINRRAGRPGWGATPAPQNDIRPDWTFTSMAEFAEAAVPD